MIVLGLRAPIFIPSEMHATTRLLLGFLLTLLWFRQLFVFILNVRFLNLTFLTSS